MSFRSFVFHSGERAEREKAWAKRLFKLQVPVEKCLSTWITRGACVYIRKCVLHQRVSPAADERPNNNKRQRENAEPRPRLRLENQTGPLSRGTRPISFPFIRDFLPAPRSFFFHAPDSQTRQFDIQLCEFNQLSLLEFLLLYCDIVPERMLFVDTEKLNK